MFVVFVGIQEQFHLLYVAVSFENIVMKNKKKNSKKKCLGNVGRSKQNG
jgi:hypothetical protein